MPPVQPYNDEDTDFLLSLPRFAAEVSINQSRNFDVNLAEYYRDRADDYCKVISTMSDDSWFCATRPDNTSDTNTALTEFGNLLDTLLVHFLVVRARLQSNVDSLLGVRQHTSRPPSTGIMTELQTSFLDPITSVSVTGSGQPRVQNTVSLQRIRTGNPGRPAIDIQPHHVVPLRELGFKWCAIAKILGVSERTLRNCRAHFHEFINFMDIPSDILDEHLQQIMSITQRSGETFMIGGLRARGIRVQRWRIRESLARIDPVGRALRRRRIIYRRRYSVPSPNYIWHIDGNHKLIDPWGFVIHGGVDGFSRLCVFLHCSTSNRACIVLNLFKEAVTEYGCPRRMRCDYGTENVEVARYMVRNQGLNRGRVLTGLSTHNQRIERLWRDVRECVTSIFSDIFFYMENEGIADRYNPIHTVAMRYIFCPRINRALMEFRNQWNNHPLRTANNKTPNMLWVQGMIENAGSLDPNELYNDDEDPVPDIQTNNNVQVPDVQLNISQQEFVQLESEINPLLDDGRQGIDLFMQAVQFLQERVELVRVNE